MKQTRWRVIAAALLLAVTAGKATAQQQPPTPPEEMEAVAFMLGEWTVSGLFRTPDHVGSDRTLWYLTEDGGVVRFDGRAWTAHAPGRSAVGDSIRSLITGRAVPYAFENPRAVRVVQDGFALLVEEGETAGTTLIHFDTEQRAWIAQGLHAPTNAITRAVASYREGTPVFEGEGTDRRGARLFRKRYVRVDEDHYRIHTDVSFDRGSTWIADQIVQDVRRNETSDTGPVEEAALSYLETLYRLEFERLPSLMADGIEFLDPPGIALGADHLSARGREAVIAAFEQGAAGTRNPGFEVHHRFEVGGFVVFTLTYFSEIAGSLVGVDRDWVPVRVPGVTILRMEGGRVVEHRDYVDHDVLRAQIEAARAGH